MELKWKDQQRSFIDQNPPIYSISAAKEDNKHRWGSKVFYTGEMSARESGCQNLETIQHIFLTEDFVYQYCMLNASVNFGSKL